LARSAKQKAATRKLVALNKKRKRSSTKKGGVRKTARRAFTGIKRKTNKAKTKRKSVKRNSVKSVLGSSTLKKVALGVGGATLATAMISFIAPNSSIAKFAAPAGAFALGGIEGIIGQFALGMLTPRPAGNQNVAPAMEVL
jgi:hypothetical protein|tara:strand:+ start:898 stop:1320 length:423 start_codon:yes stop_codon:yes gene_type:complete